MTTTSFCNHICPINNKRNNLLCRDAFLTFFFLLFSISMPDRAIAQQSIRLVFWNVENFFDIFDDTTRNDDAFTPGGQNHWSNQRYERKLTNITKTLVALGRHGDNTFSMPTVVGMAEVENDKVLRDLCQGTPLRRFGYGHVHFDSPDRRGIDVALLYRKEQFTPFLSQAINVSDSSQDFLTRDLLLVEGTLFSGDTLALIICHFPSKLGGTTSDKRRAIVAGKLRNIMDSVQTSHPFGTLVVMGDFNGAPDEEELSVICRSIKGISYTNLMADMEPGKGSYRHQDHWSCLDQIIVSTSTAEPNSDLNLRLKDKRGKIFDAPFLLLDDDKHLGKKVFRTFLGMRYQGGYSDHLPVYIDMNAGNSGK